MFVSHFLAGAERIAVTVRGDEPLDQLQGLVGLDAVFLLAHIPASESETTSRVHAARRWAGGRNGRV